MFRREKTTGVVLDEARILVPFRLPKTSGLEVFGPQKQTIKVPQSHISKLLYKWKSSAGLFLG